MNERYVVLKSVNWEGRTKIVLVHIEEFNGSPSDYFTQEFWIHARREGEVTIDGDVDFTLPDTLEGR